MKKNHTPSKVKKGFTLTELLVVIAILAVLSTITVIGYTHFIKKAAISSDNLLVNQVNTVINTQRIYQNIENDNDIARLLQKHFEKDVQIATKKYDMDIYYNNEKKQFELMLDKEAGNYINSNLHYYLNMVVEDEDINTDKPNANKVEFTFNDYYWILDDNEEEKKILVKASYEGDSINITVFSNSNSSTFPIEIDLSKIITATDEYNNSLNITFELVENNNLQLHGDILTFTSTSICNLNYFCENIYKTIGLSIEKKYWSTKSEINAADIKCEYDNSTQTLKLSNIIYGITISDYISNSEQLDKLQISENKELLNNIFYIITIDEQLVYYAAMNSEKYPYDIVINNIHITTDSVISIHFIYKDSKNEYCYYYYESVNIN